jgi:hypothetical protein
MYIFNWTNVDNNVVNKTFEIDSDLKGRSWSCRNRHMNFYPYVIYIMRLQQYYQVPCGSGFPTLCLGYFQRVPLYVADRYHLYQGVSIFLADNWYHVMVERMLCRFIGRSQISSSQQTSKELGTSMDEHFILSLLSSLHFIVKQITSQLYSGNYKSVNRLTC